MTSSVGRATGHLWDDSWTTDEKIMEVLARITGLHAELGEVQRELRAEMTQVESRLTTAHGELNQRVDSLRTQVTESTQEDERIAARGLPIVVSGIFLSGVSPTSTFSGWAGNVLSLLGVAAALWALATVVRQQKRLST